jgi:hypothetical protein
MAIYHLSLKTISRSSKSSNIAQQFSAVAAAAYRAGQNLEDGDGVMHKYKRRQRGVMSAELHLPPGVSLDRGELWRMAEAAEKRCNSVLAREVEISLPHELAADEQVALAGRMGAWLAARYSVGVDCAVHVPGKGKDTRNVHAHLLFTTRVLTPGGLGEKTRILDDRKTGSVEVEAIREHWASLCNAALARHGVAAQIDHRSYERQGVYRMPTMHVGKGKYAWQRRRANEQIQEIEAQVSALKKRRRELAQKREALTPSPSLSSPLVGRLRPAQPAPAEPEAQPARRKFRR